MLQGFWFAFLLGAATAQSILIVRDVCAFYEKRRNEYASGPQRRANTAIILPMETQTERKETPTKDPNPDHKP
jgi:hypothetical protein